MKKSFLVVLVAACAALPVFAAAEDLFEAIRATNQVKLEDELRYNYITDKSAVMDGKTPLMAAVEQEWRLGVDMILKKRVNVNAKGNNGETALHVAAKGNKDPEIIKLLVSNGANLNAQDDTGKTILMYAAENEAQVVFDYLLKQPGVNKNLVDNNGEDALVYAAKNNNSTAVIALLNSGGLTNFNRYGRLDRKTAFMWAIDKENTDMVRAFLESGKVDMFQAVPGVGSNPALPVLLWAINNRKSLSIIREMIDTYTESLDDIVDKDGNTAYYYATLRKNTAVLNELKKKGHTVANAYGTGR